MRAGLYLIFIVLFSVGAVSCNTKKGQETDQQITNFRKGAMEAKIVTRITFSEIPSASGMEAIGNKIYVIGDDSPFLFVLDRKSFRLLNKIRLFDSKTYANGRIPKAFKTDLECLTTINFEGQTYLAAFGSGSAPTRAYGYLIQLPNNPKEEAIITEYSLKELYSALQSDENLLAGDRLNIEAAATHGDKLYLLQRATQAGPNALLSFSVEDFMRHLTVPGAAIPAYEAVTFELPNLFGLDARFSGAYALNELLFFTASVENTKDAILDGEILGSFIGTIAINDIKPGRKPIPLNTSLVFDEKSQPFKGKIESLTVINTANSRTVRALAMTDNDAGPSDLLELKFTMK